MITLTGKKVSEGIAIGKLSFYHRDQKDIRKISVKDVEKEIARFYKAREKAIAEITEVCEVAIKEVGEANAMIFEAQKTLLEDQEFTDKITKSILEEKLNAEYIVSAQVEAFLQDKGNLNKSNIIGHETDIRDAYLRLVRILTKSFKDRVLYDEPFILAAKELYPSETLQLDKSKVLGFVTIQGTLNSHTAVLARTKGLPAVIGIGEALKEEYEGKTIVVDGFAGKVYIEPDYTTLTKLKKKRDTNFNYRKNLERLTGKENVTQSGLKIDIFANVATREDV
jgi:phosphotransferase system enzyme I (PtsI)